MGSSLALLVSSSSALFFLCLLSSLAEEAEAPRMVPPLRGIVNLFMYLMKSNLI